MIGSNLVRLLGPQTITCDLQQGGIDLLERKNCYWAKDAMVFDCASPTRGIGSNDFLEAARIPMNLLAAKPYHFVYASSSCVYPDDAPLPTSEEHGFSGEPEEANRGYGWAKRAGELACRYSGVRCTIVRLSNIYGPSYNWANPIKHVIPSLIEKMLRGDNPLIVWGSGDQTRSFMFEEDCARLMLALSSEEGTYNLGGTEFSIAGLVHLLAEITKYKGRIVFDTTKPEGPKRKLQDTQRLESVLGKIVTTPLEKGLQLTVETAYDALRNHRISRSA